MNFIKTRKKHALSEDKAYIPMYYFSQMEFTLTFI